MSIPSPAIRVGLVAPTLQLLGGHAVQAARLIAAWHGDDEVSVRLVPINPAPPSVLAPLTRIKYLRTAVTQLCYWPSLLRELQRVDVVHVFSPSNASFFRSSAPAILLGLLHGKRVVVNYRGDGREHLSRSRLARRLLQAVDVIAVPSVYFYEIFREFNLSSQIVPNIADLAAFRYRVRDPLHPRLLSTRNFEPIYNVQCTIRAFARVQQRYPDATLALVGSGSEERALRNLVDSLSLRGVIFAGPVSPCTISRFYDAADIYVQTPVIDNTPGSVIEAFASGLPVVATRVGGVPALLEHRVHGLLAPSNDDETIARHVMFCLEHPRDAERMAAAAAATCRAYDATLVRERWRAVYTALMAVQRSSRNHVLQS